MKFAIGFKGVHYMNGEFNWKIDFEEQIQNFFEKIVNPLKQKGNTVDIFLSTYESPKSKRLYELYNPVDVSFLEFFPKEERYDAQYRHHINLYNNIIQYQIKNSVNYDFVITTRFDIEMNISIDEMNINFSMFNIMFKNDYDDAEDCLWFFPGEDLLLVTNSLERMKGDKQNLHKIERYYTKKINFLLSIKDYIAHPYINLKRTLRDFVWSH
jgi:hypothetical protein